MAESTSMSSLVGHGGAPDGLRLGRYLPLSVAVTLAVIALPLVAVAQLGAARTPLTIGLHVIAAAVLAIVVARLLALVWTRHPHSTDLVFGDLLIWGWARRAWAERRLERLAHALGDPDADPESQEGLLQRLSALLEARDPYTHGHSRRVARHSERIADALGLPREQVAKVRAAALVHDLGKINVPRSVLTKPSRLTDAEFDLVKRHPGDGAALVAKLGDPELAAMVRHHHERLDGKGYPAGLAGNDIPLGARIIAVADTFDAITSARAYRPARAHKQALDIVRAEAGTQLDPDAVEAFLGYYKARRSIGWAAILVAAPQRLLSGLGGVPSGVAVGAAPLAQTACGVGAAALIGACLSTSTPALHSDDPVAKVNQVALSTEPASSSSPALPGSSGGGGHGISDRPGRAQHAEDRGSTRAPADESVPRSLDVPDNEGNGAPAPKGSGQPSPGAGGELPAVDDLPVAIPDPDEVVPPVDELPPPQVQLPPVQVPPVQLPGVQVGPVQVPPLQVQVPQVKVPGLLP